MATRSIRLEGEFRLRSPLSHIGETISNTAYLVEDMVLQPQGGVERVFGYSGNAWRGQMRDLMASYMLDKLDRPALGLDAFHLLFSGGRIGGQQSTDIAQARRIRRAIPLVALLGGGIGNQILQGKARFGTCYPLCAEAAPVLPQRLQESALAIPYADLTFLKEYSRRDDSKIESVAGYLGAPETHGLIGDGAAPKKNKAGKETSEVATQMRLRGEFLVPGARLHTWIMIEDATEEEIGCLVSGLHRFSRSPHIGGQSSRGHGLVDVSYEWKDLDTGEGGHFLRVADGECLLAPPAAAAKEAYDQALRTMYDRQIESNKPEIAGLLGAA